MKTQNNVVAFCAGYISALSTAGVEWEDWAVPLSIDCCAIDLIREDEKVRVIAYHPSGLRHEFVMKQEANMYGDPEWVKE